MTMAAYKNFSLAGVLMASPWWIEPLTNVSTIAALLLPVVGLAVGIVQLYRLLSK
jgi:hypothetical protein